MSSSKLRSALDKTIVAGLLLAIIFTPLALGTVESWSEALFELLIVLLILLWAAKAIVERHLVFKFPPASLPLAGLVLLGLAQSIALTGSAGETSSLSMDVEATRGAVTTIFFLFLSFLIVTNFFNTPERLRTLATTLIIFGLALGVFALVQHFTWEGKMFWVRPMPIAGDGNAGPFVNRNHFAGYMEMLIPIPIALAFSRAVRGEARLFYGFAAAIMGIAEVASLSRGGLASLAAGLFFLTAIIVWQKRSARHSEGRSSFGLGPALMIVAMLAAIGAGVIWVGADLDVLRRMTNDPLTTGANTDRPAVWRDAYSMFRSHPIAGTGLGTFEAVYPNYGHGNGTFVIQYAHNDYLQVLADGGVVGGALAIWFIIVIFRAFFRGLRSRDIFVSTFALGAGAGIIALLVHSLFDFNLQIPSNALLFLVLSAALSGIERRADDGVSDETVRTRRIRSDNRTKPPEIATGVGV